MSRLSTRSHGQQNMLSGLKTSRSKDLSAEKYNEPPRGRKLRRSHAATVQSAKKRRRASSTTVASSENEDDAADEASDEDNGDDDEEPAVKAPPPSYMAGQVGRKYQMRDIDDVSVVESVGSMFADLDYHHDNEDPNLSPDENMRRFEQKVFADSEDENDDFYRAVDDISDSDEENVDQHEEQQIIANLTDDDIGDYLNQIDGMSAFGFGDESDGTARFPPSSPGSENAADDAVQARHVHFDVDHAQSLRMALSESPTISRALLPSAMSENIFGEPPSASLQQTKGPPSEDTYDSDATDDDLPEEAFKVPPVPQMNEDKSVSKLPSPKFSKPARRNSQRKGPPLGVFIDEGTKPSGILDSTGRKLLMSQSHLFGQEFARRSTTSASSTPDMPFAEMQESDGMSQASGNSVIPPGMDAMISGNNSFHESLNPARALAANGAFVVAPGFQAEDYDIEGQDLEQQIAAHSDYEEEHFIKFDEEETASDGATSPIFMPPQLHKLTSSGGLEHLNSSNISAFRQHADSRRQYLHNTPSFSRQSDLNTPPRSRKRKAESPYTSSHYHGVTAVSRVRDPNCPSTPDAARPKRPRLMTA